MGIVRDSKGGYAAVDALVALTVLATTVSLSVTAVHTARRSVAAAAETREVAALGRRLLSIPLNRPLEAADGAYRWGVSFEPLPDRIEGCLRHVRIDARTSGKVYRLTGASPCPEPEAAAA